uniref:Uncharacterized protein n=1 Tax=Romanomermis culicivorax TaxID=13658 RepID=A0A915L5D3_ROMCU
MSVNAFAVVRAGTITKNRAYKTMQIGNEITVVMPITCLKMLKDLDKKDLKSLKRHQNVLEKMGGTIVEKRSPTLIQFICACIHCNKKLPNNRPLADYLPKHQPMADARKTQQSADASADADANKVGRPNWSSLIDWLLDTYSLAPASHIPNFYESHWHIVLQLLMTDLFTVCLAEEVKHYTSILKLIRLEPNFRSQSEFLEAMAPNRPKNPDTNTDSLERLMLTSTLGDKTNEEHRLPLAFSSMGSNADLENVGDPAIARQKFAE